MEIDKKLYAQIKEYCDINGLKPKEYINDILSKAFMRDKYGDKPSISVTKSHTVSEEANTEIIRKEPRTEIIEAPADNKQITSNDADEHVKTEENNDAGSQPTTHRKLKAK